MTDSPKKEAMHDLCWTTWCLFNSKSIVATYCGISHHPTRSWYTASGLWRRRVCFELLNELGNVCCISTDADLFEGLVLLSWGVPKKLLEESIELMKCAHSTLNIYFDTHLIRNHWMWIYSANLLDYNYFEDELQNSWPHCKNTRENNCIFTNILGRP